MARETPRSAERWLTHIVQINRKSMGRKGIAPDLADAELHRLEGAIRTQLARIVVEAVGHE
jgi:hypothetical protein